MSPKAAFMGGLTADRLMTVIDSLSEGVMAIDRNMSITLFNKAAERITGYSRDSAVGHNCFEILHADCCTADCPLRRTVASGELVIHRTSRSVTASGRSIPLSLSTFLWRDRHHRVAGGVESFRDISREETLRKMLERSYSLKDIIGRNRRMQELFALLPVIARNDSDVLIHGEGGSGRELVARAIHNSSARKSRPFVAINCTIMPDTLVVSELCGDRRESRGCLARAEGGTLFLHDVGDLNMDMQTRLLHLLQERTYLPPGGSTPIKADVRIIAATRKDLAAMTGDGLFLRDLYRRLQAVRISIPPLHDRMDDLPLLADNFIDRFNHATDKNISGLAPAAVEILMDYNFPGNVHELESIIARAFIVCPGGLIEARHLPRHLRREQRIPILETARTLGEMEGLFLMASLERNNWNRMKTAKTLGIDISTLYRKIKKLGLQVPQINGRTRHPFQS
jgi:PAS domain S-box-containing protein